LRLSLHHHPGGVSADGPARVVYDIDGAQAHVAPAAVAGPALVWELTDGDAPAGALLSADVELDPATRWLMRCDRVDFGPGGIAYRHTHPGPGIRFLLFGEITIETGGATHTYGPGGAWFERGPDPVLATTTEREPSAFVRVMLLPVAYEGQRTIRYVDPRDADKPKTQKATIFLEQHLPA
jgi:quercetin dioxygenase-like cupin family protein